MNANRLFAVFAQLSDAPNAMLQLRRFVLDLAVRGELVPPDVETEAISAAPKIARTEMTRGNELTEARPYLVPPTWNWHSIEEVAVQVSDGEHATPARIVDHQVPLVTAKNVRDGKMVYDQTDWVSHETAVKAWGRCRPIPGDILLVCVGATIGRLCVLREKRDMVLVRSVALIRPSTRVDADFLALALRSPAGQAEMWRRAKVAAQPCLYLNRIRTLCVPLPPLAEQHRIVAKVNELMAVCDQLEAAQEEGERRRGQLLVASLGRLTAPTETPGRVADKDVSFFLSHSSRMVTKAEHVTALRRSIIKLAIQGGLVDTGAGDADAETTLLIGDQRRTEVARRDRRADAERQVLLGSDRLWSTPSHWAWRGLADLALFIDYRGKTPSKTDHGVPLVTAKNVRRGRIDAHPAEFISPEEYKTWMTRGLPEPGDVLLTTEAPMGNAAVVRGAEPFALAQRVIALRSYGAVDPDFLVLQILSEPFFEILDWAATGLTAKGIKGAKLKRLPIAVPPLAEQRRIVAKVEELMAVCDELERSLTAVEMGRARALEAVLHEVREETGGPVPALAEVAV